MKKFLTILFLITFFSAGAQVGTVVSIPTSTYSRPGWLQLPSGYSSTSINYPVIIYLHGTGESSGTTASDSTYQAGGYLNKIYNNSGSGPAYWIEHAQWPDSFQNPKDSRYYKFIVLSVQNNSWSLAAGDVHSVIDWVKSNYRIDTNRIYLTGLSAGGEGVTGYESNYDIESKISITRSTLPAAVVPMSMALNIPAGDSVRSTWAFQAVADSIPNWGFGSPSGDVYGTYTQEYIAFMNQAKSGYARFTNYSGGHCCWGTFYVPTYTENINGVNMSIYQWMLTNSRAVVLPSIRKNYLIKTGKLVWQ